MVTHVFDFLFFFLLFFFLTATVHSDDIFIEFCSIKILLLSGNCQFKVVNHSYVKLGLLFHMDVSLHLPTLHFACHVVVFFPSWATELLHNHSFTLILPPQGERVEKI